MKNFMKMFLACSVFATSGWGTTEVDLTPDEITELFGNNAGEYFTVRVKKSATTPDKLTLFKIRSTSKAYTDPATGQPVPYPLNIKKNMNGLELSIANDTTYNTWDGTTNNTFVLQKSSNPVFVKLDNLKVNTWNRLFFASTYLIGADLSLVNTTDTGTTTSLKETFLNCRRLNTLIVSPKFGTNATDSDYWSSMFFDVSGLKIYSTGTGSSIEELFHPSLIGIIKGGTYNGVNYGSGYTADKVQLVTDVPPGYTRPHYDLVIAGTKNEIKSPEDTTILSIDKDAVVGMANGAVLTNSGQIKGPAEGSAYFKLYGGAKSATITNKASFAVDSSLSSKYSGKTCYVPSIAVFDTQHITLDDGITVTTEKADLAKHPEIIGSSSNVVVLATPTESTEPIKISQTGSTPLTINAAFANDTTDTNLKPRDLEISGKVNLAGDLSKFTNGTLKITNSKFEFKTKKSLPQNVECTDSVVKLPRGADITGRIAAKGRSRLEIRCNHIRSGARISFK